MYIPEHFAERRPEHLHRIIRDNPLGILVSQGESAMDADHLPFELDTAHGAHGLLSAHVARANPLWQRCDGRQVLVIFRGAQGYISPNGYVSKHETHRQVPTWNYEVVHVQGVLRVMPEEKLLRRTLALLTRQHEAGESKPWRMGDAPRDYLDEMVAKIVGIEIEPLRLECKRKLNQNKDHRDRLSVISHLRERGHEALVSAMQQE
ncbi:FMN-binding negative transcriptional regulator [Pseudomonas gingeri]|uniref:FMN-binding negative transcriptional regulator n=1 Tax=Pseudomonas gingeri TaxID=117681 RepID=UPI0015A4C710|nr:FMN-binding negative transcriptional regulator [Pseudomonas gingeri]NVZ27900.1 FMN-binding negative transcriptional regulator [Pseudomonas gingeri]NWA05887.1 FMN-binding negative transcriptional regulator [Pseudomonas gingeri]